ncbi:MAG: lipopolysaccharide biosynthesis protein [Abditibacteriota bacterium]|nr:lipopolysaccharide biosynthesis protein [Abditibacteriota bacterium]
MSDFRRKAKSGFLYKFAERAGAQGTSFVISMVLARLLLPSQYGVVAMVMVFIAICDVFVISGFGKSLIANKDSDHLDFSTCLWFSLGIAVVLYALVYFSAPYIAVFYHESMLVPVIRVMALKLPVTALSCVQESYTSKHLMFKKFFYATLTGTLASGVISITMAYMGCGVWALVCQNLSRALINAAVLWCIVGWRPKAEFSFQRLKKIYDFGWKILAMGLLDTVYAQLRNLIIGKKYSAADLAFYNKGHQFPHTGMAFVEPTITGVLFPALAKCQDDRDQMRSIVRRITKVSSYVTFPIMAGLAVMAKPLILLILTEKWLESVVYLQIGCLAMASRPLIFVNVSVIMACKEAGLLLKLDLLKKGIGVILLIISMFFGIYWVAMSLAITNFICALINIWPNKKLLNYGYLLQIKDVIPSLLMSSIMGAAMYSVLLLSLNDTVILLLQTIIGLATYLILTRLFKDDSLAYLITTLKSLAAKKK